MKLFKTRTVPAKEQQYTDKVLCDLCGKETRLPSYVVDEVEVEAGKEKRDYCSIRIRRKTGASYPEGGSGEYTTFDLCGACFEAKLIPWFAAQSVSPTVEEWDW